ncbi:MAG: glutamine synthetase [Candidatus Anoxymicrobium japonicum]|uniref:Glutamine synthetase n=1 Tax=Candidatus Anoxymicrobium japonicum TaxID=2013648 RepID=A0A2N3G673_9ACTN|nr:MAG: glutamine synthetase [Candidatus Anoxymicrobium japonicum]
MTGSQDKEHVIEAVREHDVKFIRLWFTDILGFLKSFAITRDELGEALESGMGFDGSSIEGFARIDESDMIAQPDPSTFVILPWRSSDHCAVARMFCDILEPDRKPHVGDPRNVLRRNLKKAQDMGYTFYVGPELEYYYFASSETPPVPLDRGGYFDMTPLDEASDMRIETVLMLEEMGVGVEYSHHEVGPSQHEIDLRYTDAMQMADNAMTYRLVVKEVAIKNGMHATFMPKPLNGQNGSGMHTHMSLFSGDRNAFFDPKDPYCLTGVARAFMAGLLKYVQEFCLVTNQFVNSYKRLVPGYEAPVYLSWAHRNRSDLIRIPTYKPGKENSTRVELRSPDPACNPYLAFAVMLAAGLKGIEDDLELREPTEGNVYEMSEDERKVLGIDSLPVDLGEAIHLAEESDFLRECLGDHVFHSLIADKKIEWNDYKAFVTEYELNGHLPVL